MNDRHFASDNNASVHPEVLSAIVNANEGHAAGYGHDPFTQRAEDAFRTLLGDQARVFFCFNGTGANVVALSAALRPWQAVICPATAHINVDECGAFERIAGGKLIDVPVRNGKLTPEDIERNIGGIGDEHHVQPAAISISQSTELGTVYTREELAALAATARKYDLLFHMDGARIANAVVSLGGEPHKLLAETGVDVFTFGGTKNGLMFGEAVVFPKYHPAVERMPFARKQGMQLASKMRYVAAQYEALLRDGLWLRNAAHANAMASRLAGRVRDVPGLTIAYPVDANAVFVKLPHESIAALQTHRRFYVWDERESIVRWMASFDTTPEDVDSFAAAIEQTLTGSAAATRV
jgi:threonine aldolase